VSVTSKGREGDAHSGLLQSAGADISADGRFVVFASDASNFAKADANANSDVFIHDRQTHTTELVSRGLDGAPATGDTPVISADGSVVAFRSRSDTLTSDGNPNLREHIYTFDRATQAIERVDVDSSGRIGDGDTLNLAISADGRYVAFDTSADNLTLGPGDGQGMDVFVRDRIARTTEGISTLGDSGSFEGNSFLSSITPDGRFVGFSSVDPTLGVPDANGFVSDAFVFDRAARTVQMVSRSSTGVQGNDESESPLVAPDGQSPGFAVMASDMSADGFTISIITAAQLLAEQNTGFNFMDVYALDMRADLSVTNSDAPDPVVLRANLTYTVTVQNGGPAAAQAVTLTDQLAADAAFVSATPSQGTCARAGKGGREGDLVCALGTIDPFHSATVAIVVKPSRAGTLTNTASVRSGSPDPNAANNAATATTTVVAK